MEEVEDRMTTDEILHKIGNCTEILELVTTPGRLFILVANLQLAIRHPGNTGASAEIAREMAENLTNMICSKVPQARNLIEQGWNPEYDLTREEYEDGGYLPKMNQDDPNRPGVGDQF